MVCGGWIWVFGYPRSNGCKSVAPTSKSICVLPPNIESLIWKIIMPLININVVSACYVIGRKHLVALPTTHKDDRDIWLSHMSKVKSLACKVDCLFSPMLIKRRFNQVSICL